MLDSGAKRRGAVAGKAAREHTYEGVTFPQVSGRGMLLGVSGLLLLLLLSGREETCLNLSYSLDLVREWKAASHMVADRAQL